MADFIPGVGVGRPAAARPTPPVSRSLSRSRYVGPSVVAVSVAVSVAVLVAVSVAVLVAVSVAVSVSRSFARTGVVG